MMTSLRRHAISNMTGLAQAQEANLHNLPTPEISVQL